MLPSSVSSLLICTRDGTVLHERQFAGGAESDPTTALRQRQAFFSVAQPLLSVARPEEEHVALLECVGHAATTALSASQRLTPLCVRVSCFSHLSSLPATSSSSGSPSPTSWCSYQAPAWWWRS
jgi:hypothetical protein